MSGCSNSHSKWIECITWSSASVWQEIQASVTAGPEVNSLCRISNFEWSAVLPLPIGDVAAVSCAARPVGPAKNAAVSAIIRILLIPAIGPTPNLDFTTSTTPASRVSLPMMNATSI